MRERRPTQRFDVEVDGANDDKRLNRVRSAITKTKKTAAIKKAVKKPTKPMHFTYFDVMAKGLGPMICLSVAEVPHRGDFCGPKDSGGVNWKTLKHTTPFGQLPLLQDGDLVVAQTTAICNYIGHKCNMLGANSDHDFAISSMLLAETEDIYSSSQQKCPTIYVKLDDPKKQGLEGYQRWATEEIPSHLDRLEQLLKAEDTLGFTESGKTVGELYFFAMLHQLVLVLPDVLATRPSLNTFYRATLARPRVKKVLDGEGAFPMRQYFVAP